MSNDKLEALAANLAFLRALMPQMRHEHETRQVTLPDGRIVYEHRFTLRAWAAQTEDESDGAGSEH